MKYILSVVLLVLSADVFSGSCTQIGCQGKAKDLFSNYYLTGWEDGRVYLHVHNNISSHKLNCSLAENAYMTLRSSHPLFSEIYSSLLAASAMDREIFVRIKNGSSNCEVSYIRFYTE